MFSFILKGMIVMSTAQENIRTFMSTLDNTSSSGTTALDEAVRSCSSFSSTADWLNSLVSACSAAKAAGYSASQILSSVCGIELYNEDTGSISGSDAGSGTVKTADSIVPENSTVSYPAASSSTFNGLTVNWPTGNLTTSEQLVLYGLNSWWINEGLNLVTNSLGLSFNESGTTVKTMNIQLVNEGQTGTLAATEYSYDSAGNTTALTLYINMDYYNNLSTSNYSGQSDSSGTYLDRTIAHELTHAVMAANIASMASLPEFVREGAAELVQGIDDLRPAQLLALASNPSALSASLNVNNTATADVYTYAAGYMALRYLAKSTAASTTTNGNFVSTSQVYYDSSKATILVAAGISGELWLDGRTGTTFASTVRNIDARASNGTAALAGNDQPNFILAGSGTSSLWGGAGQVNDTLVGGSNTDCFYYGVNEGTDYIENSTSADKVMLYDAGFSYTSAQISGSNLIINSTTGSLVITNWSESGMNTFQLANGDQYRFTQSGSSLTPQKI